MQDIIYFKELRGFICHILDLSMSIVVFVVVQDAYHVLYVEAVEGRIEKELSMIGITDQGI